LVKSPFPFQKFRFLSFHPKIFQLPDQQQISRHNVAMFLEL
jgi:hypothetical protein